VKIISSGSKYEVFSDDDVLTYDALPAGTYVVFSDNKGLFLRKTVDLEVNETVYDELGVKTSHVLKSFSKSSRNLGVVLSGEKGLGKSFFGRLLCSEARKNGIPTVIVPGFYVGLPEFLNSIRQEVVVFFDEFDKTFDQEIDTAENTPDIQSTMLGFFDGTSYGKKLFVATCNDISALSDMFVNRPGRFHYHFKFSYPGEDAVYEYLNENLVDKSSIEDIIRFSRLVPLSYDSLRAICFESNLTKEPFDKTIKMLNVLPVNPLSYYTTLYYESNGKKRLSSKELDLTPGDDSDIYVDFDEEDSFFRVRFNFSTVGYDEKTSCFYTIPEMVVNGTTDQDIELDRITFVRKEKVSFSFKHDERLI
jgi:hypothetical protein